MFDFPKIVIEVEGGVVTAVYYDGQPILCAIADADEAELGGEHISVVDTMPIEAVPQELVDEIKAFLSE